MSSPDSHIKIKVGNIDFDIKQKKIVKYCWFCDTKCYNFISICKTCKNERFKKIKIDFLN